MIQVCALQRTILAASSLEGGISYDKDEDTCQISTDCFHYFHLCFSYFQM